MDCNSLNRRQLLENSVIAAGVAAACSVAVRSADAAGETALSDGATVLFQGDSITDARRDRRTQGQANNPRAMGDGYPMLIGCELLRDHPTLGLRVFNRGISGNKVPDLQTRWQADCLDMKPSVLSILIGVNDIWHKLNGRYEGTVADYQREFTELLTETRQALPKTTIVVCEPFVLRCGAVKENWFPEFDERRAAAKEVATAAKTLWVPFQTMFDEAVAAGSQPQYWAADGVHPSMAGHSLMAKAWRAVVGI